MTRAVAFALIVIGVLVAWTARARAADAVVVAAPVPADPIAARAHDELEALGFEVLDAVVSDDASAPTILVGHAHARAIVHVRPPGADVWIVDPGTHAPVLRESIAPTGSTEKTKHTQVALRAVEVVRASLLPTPEPVATPEPVIAPPPAPPPPVPEARPEPPPTLRRRTIELGIGGGLASFPISPGFAAELAMPVAGPIDVGLLAAFAPARRSINESEGTARVGFGVAAVRIRYRLGVESSAVHLGAGAGVVRVDVRGSATSPNEASSVTMYSPALVASATYRARLVGPLDLWIDLATVLTRPIVVRFVDREVARFAASGLLIAGVGASF